MVVLLLFPPFSSPLFFFSLSFFNLFFRAKRVKQRAISHFAAIIAPG